MSNGAEQVSTQVGERPPPEPVPVAPRNDPAAALTAPRRDSVDRTLSVGAALLAIMQLVLHLRPLLESLQRDPFWGPANSLVVVLLLITIVSTPMAPMRLLRRLWAAVAVLGMLLRWVWVFTGHDLTEQPWAYFMQPTFAVYAALAWPFLVAVGVALAGIMVPPVLDGLGLVAIAPDVAVDSSRQLLNVSIIVVVHVTRHERVRVALSAQTVAQAKEAAAQAEAAQEERERMLGLIHDEILAGLRAVAQDSGEDHARAEAAAAIEVVISELDQPDRPTRPVDLGVVLAAVTARIFPQAPVDLPPGSLVVPPAVAVALAGATREALRNVARHAGPAGVASVRVVVTGDPEVGVRIQIVDDGLGFDPEHLDRRRLGLHHGVIARMRRLPSGVADVSSAPGRGTTVTLRWAP